MLGPLLNSKFENWINKEHFPTLEAAMKAIDTAVDANMKARENQKRIAVLFPDTPWIRHQFEIRNRALAEFKKAEAELTPFIIPARRYPRRAVAPPTASEIMSLLTGLEAEIDGRPHRFNVGAKSGLCNVPHGQRPQSGAGTQRRSINCLVEPAGRRPCC